MDQGRVVARAAQTSEPGSRPPRSTFPAAMTLAVVAIAAMGAAPNPDAAPFETPLAHSPLTAPLAVTGGFGEYRIGHFHAGFDFGTGHVVGKTVFAPLDGHIERLRASGVGYGRSIYLRARDGRLLQFGHLDAFAEPMASWIAAIQDSTGQYEQDLWPEPARFPVHAGQRIAWTGQSGAGGPHMHFEIRRGDIAYHPMRAGLVTPDESAPTLVSVTLEPLDDTSYVEGSAAPVTRRFRAGAETLSVIGRVRAIIGARDGVWKGVDRMVPWLTRMEWAGQWIECRMDSVSWATDMVESDYVFDAGRVVGDKGIVLWASRGYRPRFVHASAPLEHDAGTIEVRRGDSPLTLTLEASDLSGHTTRRTVVVDAAEGGPDTTGALVLKHPRTGEDRFEFAALPRGFLRVTYHGNGAGSRRVRLGFAGEGRMRPATPGPAGWTAVLNVSGTIGDRIRAVGSMRDGRMTEDAGSELYVTQDSSRERAASPVLDWELPQTARFDSSSVIWRRVDTSDGPLAGPEAPSELVHGKVLGQLGPDSEPLRSSVGLRLSSGSDGSHFGLYRHDRDGWSWIGGRTGAGDQFESRRLGWFAEFEDTLGPRIGFRTPSRKPSAGPYSRWALEASLAEKGSGVDAHVCHFVVDGKRVPTEWDPEADVLRWRPMKRPKAGTHRYDVIAADRAGNLSVRSGSFVLD